MLKALGPDLASMTVWSAADTEINSETAEVVDRTPRVHQLQCCLPIYDSAVDRSKPIRMLEIGSVYGNSLQKWKEYLHPDSIIVGVDIDSKFVKIADAEGINFRIGGERSDSFLREVAAEFGPFDVIIDAGSQTSSHIVNTFGYLFKNALRDNGVYLVEDVYCDYWTLYNSFSLTDLVGALIDFGYGHYQVATSAANFRVGHLVVVHRNTGNRRGRASTGTSSHCEA
jgi:predicted O-methyltransferase YrrM